jgi:hypothetical protein
LTPSSKTFQEAQNISLLFRQISPALTYILTTTSRLLKNTLQQLNSATSKISAVQGEEL